MGAKKGPHHIFRLTIMTHDTRERLFDAYAEETWMPEEVRSR